MEVWSSAHRKKLHQVPAFSVIGLNLSVVILRVCDYCYVVTGFMFCGPLKFKEVTGIL